MQSETEGSIIIIKSNSKDYLNCQVARDTAEINALMERSISRSIFHPQIKKLYSEKNSGCGDKFFYCYLNAFDFVY
jgi:hypothetical protein